MRLPTNVFYLRNIFERRIDHRFRQRQILDRQENRNIFDGVGHVILKLQVAQQIATVDRQKKPLGDGLSDFILDDIRFVLHFEHLASDILKPRIVFVTHSLKHRADERNALHHFFHMVAQRLERRRTKQITNQRHV